MTTQEKLTVKREELIYKIREEGKSLKKLLADKRQELGHRYNKKNALEEMYRRFGDPIKNAEKFADEYILLIQKKSQLPASVRRPIFDICFMAYKKCLADKLNAMRNEHEEKAPEAKSKRKAKKA